jgi:hypothetical protein
MKAEMNRLLSTLAFFLLAGNAAYAADAVKSADDAIKIGRKVCRLDANENGGSWHAILHANENSWHVWFGKTPEEPICGFQGALVQADGSFTGCAVSACSLTPRTK